MIDVREAGPADADELMTLRGEMLRAMDGAAPPGEWLRTGAALLRERLAAPSPRVAAFVVDRDDVPGLAACALGEIDQRLPGPRDPTGLRGYVYNVATRPGHRRRGYSRACMTALLAWYANQGVTVIDLRASPDGAPLYADLGFRPVTHPAMRRIG